LGGVGKTQTALEYAHQHLDEYDYVFWVSAASQETLLSGYVTIAGLLNLSEAGARDQALAVAAVQRWFGSHGRWLIILDNADDLAMAREFLPPAKGGHALLTSRAGAVGTLARRVEIKEMGLEEGALFLLRRAGCIVEHALLEAANPIDQAKAKGVVAQLDGLPLALDQAGAYIDETSCGLSGYLDLYQKHAPDLLRFRGTLDPSHPDPVASTWALSFENIEKANPAGAELLKFCAFLHPDAIPEEVFREGASELGPVLGAVASDELALNRAIAETLKYSLLRRDPNARTLEIHRLVQTVLKQEGMDEAMQCLWAERAVRAVNRAFPRAEFATWTECERLLPQALACAELICRWGFGFPEAARLLYETGVCLFDRSRYDEVEPLYQWALSIREQALGPDCPEVTWTLQDLAGLYRVQGRYREAEALCVQVQKIRERTLGPEHPDLASILHGLAGLYCNQQRYREAEELFLRARKIRERALGPEDPALAWTLQNLAGLYRVQQRYAEAEPLYRRALEIQQKTLNPQDPTMANTLNDLATLLRDTNRLEEAERLFSQALDIQRKVLDPDHSDIATSLNDLAGLYYKQGQYALAEPLYQNALSIREKVLGRDHLDVAACLEDYARLLQAAGRPEAAGPLEARAKAIRAKCASKTPPITQEPTSPPAA
jgi:tetratricopeptide (TPR) repeat protein